ncbi:hypothetical protein K493DRAFT_372958 [Basidiobolus meristosporus CBS 931.73]|uniref:RGS domain-containing protein n=1 Tax=Basidiobolus meristosporus CBS 931.73 TaxID=1314790 RepID=A0A1Y1YAD7_9FUNG|nr:hypothetical protein K493DRAFT_372958 [Basidiobolus meristosporus CBS 931.73]|eukprot:ORX94971.1 hypothetical protein K493DRAFT_372958 [Basidiobolus meristosporus CBS 931.73]
MNIMPAESTTSRRAQLKSNAVAANDKSFQKPPTLEQTLRNKATSPFTLAEFYHYLKNRNLGEEQYLTFWLEAERHEEIWRVFLKQIRTSNMTPKPTTRDIPLAHHATQKTNPNLVHRSPSTHIASASGTAPKPDTALDGDAIEVVAEKNTLNLHKLRENVQRICLEYVPEDPEKAPIVLPEEERQRLITANSQFGHFDEHILDNAKIYVFDVLNFYYYPNYLDHLTDHNITGKHSIFRLILAFLMLALGFSIALTLIFIDYRPRWWRIWAFPPLAIGWTNLVIGLDRFCPIFGLYEYT